MNCCRKCSYNYSTTIQYLFIEKLTNRCFLEIPFVIFVKYHFLFLFKFGINVFDICLKHVEKYMDNVLIFFSFCDYKRLFGINIIIKTFNVIAKA